MTATDQSAPGQPDSSQPDQENAGYGGQPEIILYSSAICPYCVAAKNFLKSRNLDWTEVRIDRDPAQRERMLARTRRTSVPQIFVGDTHVGGYDELIALHRAGELDALLGR